MYQLPETCSSCTGVHYRTCMDTVYIYILVTAKEKMKNMILYISISLITSKGSMQVKFICTVQTINRLIPGKQLKKLCLPGRRNFKVELLVNPIPVSSDVATSYY